MVDGIGDAPFIGYSAVDFTAKHFAGNHIIVKHAENEYGFYAHLIKGTLEVKPGDKVVAGSILGLCGHSGHSSEPHLHFHLQDGPDFFNAIGLPIQFQNVVIEKKHIHGKATVERGQIVCQIE